MARRSTARDTGTGFGERVPFGEGSAASWSRHALPGTGRPIGTAPALKEPSTGVAEGAFHAAPAPPDRARLPHRAERRAVAGRPDDPRPRRRRGGPDNRHRGSDRYARIPSAG